MENKTTSAKTDNTLESIIDSIFASEDFKIKIKESAANAINDAIEKSFAYGPLRNAIDEKIRSTLVPYIEKYDISEYVPKLDAVLTDIINSPTINGEKRILKNFKALCTEEDMTKTTLETIFKEYCEHVAHYIDTTDRDIDDDDPSRYVPVNCSMEIQNSSFSDIITRYDVILRTDEDIDELEFAFTLCSYNSVYSPDSDIYQMTIHRDPSIRNLRHMSEFEIYLLRLSQYGSIICKGDETYNAEIEIDDQPT